MDLLRSCYSTQARFKDGCDKTETIQWEFAAAGAAWFPDWHAFGSLNYASTPLPVESLGEVQPSPRSWRNGSGAAAAGLDLVGEIGDFQDGRLADPCLSVSNCNGGITPAGPLYFRIFGTGPGWKQWEGNEGILTQVAPDLFVYEGFFPDPFSGPNFARIECAPLPGNSAISVPNFHFSGDPPKSQWALPSSCNDPVRWDFQQGKDYRVIVQDVPFATPPGPSFSAVDVFRRSDQRVLAQILDLSYQNLPQVCAGLAEAQWGGPVEISQVLNDNSAVPGSVILKFPRFFLVAVSGTSNPLQWFNQLTDSALPMVDQGAYSTMASWATSAAAVRARMVAAGWSSGIPTIYCGHSMGGAVSNLLLADHRQISGSVALLGLTLGSPKGGDIRLSRLLRSERIARIVNTADPVPSVPIDARTSIFLSVGLNPFTIYFWCQYRPMAGLLLLHSDGILTAESAEPDLLGSLLTIALDYVLSINPTPPASHSSGEYRRRLEIFGN